MTPKIVSLYCPGSRADLLEKALTRGADAVIYDLEDAVLPTDKERARDELASFLRGLSPEESRPAVHVRVNAPGTPWHDDDLEQLGGIAALQGIRLPKVQSARDIEQTTPLPEKVELHALVETAIGVRALDEICASPRITGVSLGDNDLRSGLHAAGPELLRHIRCELVLSLAAAGKSAPMGSAYPQIRDTEGLRADCLTLKGMGFLGRTAIHPGQIPVIREAFRPDSDEVRAAEELLAAVEHGVGVGLGAFQLPDGRFVDEPIIADARHVLELHRATRG